MGGVSYGQICVIYLLLALGFGILTFYRRQQFMAQLLAQIVVDIVIISLLYLLAGGMKSGLAILFLFPLASAAILVQLTLALFFASAVSIFLLLQSVFHFFKTGVDGSGVQAGLYGAAFMSAVYILNRLAARLISQETLAIQRGEHLQIQQAINQLVIASMDDGLLVIGRDSEVFACNPSAERKLGLNLGQNNKDQRLSDIASLRSLSDAFFAWHQQLDKTAGNSAEDSAFIKIKPTKTPAPPVANFKQDEGGALVVHLKIRFAKVQMTAAPEERFVIFLQDVARIESQAQQLKLASMGRLTASIAHEVRNPLSAISHASALLGEEATSQSQLRLLNIVAENVARMNRMIEDILNLSRKAQSHEMIGVAEIVEQVSSSITEMHQLPSEMIQFQDEGSLIVRFDPLHLREVLLNLLTNAIRYASGRAGSIRIHTVPATANRLELHVQDDGPSITPEVCAHLFEPFYTTSSKGTGLGLYLARELCLNNSAMLDYEFHPDIAKEGEYTGRFVISFPVSI